MTSNDQDTVSDIQSRRPSLVLTSPVDDESINLDSAPAQSHGTRTIRDASTAALFDQSSDESIQSEPEKVEGMSKPASLAKDLERKQKSDKVAEGK